MSEWRKKMKSQRAKVKRQKWNVLNSLLALRLRAFGDFLTADVMHHFYQRHHAIVGSVRQQAVAEVEDMAAAVGHLVKHALGRHADEVLFAVQHDGVKVSHDPHALAQALPGFVDLHVRINTDH